MTRHLFQRPAHWLLAISIGVTLWLPGLAQACSVCMTGREDENRLAFILSTAFMSLLPLILVGAVILWLRKLARHNRIAQLSPEPGPPEERRLPAPITSAL